MLVATLSRRTGHEQVLKGGHPIRKVDIVSHPSQSGLAAFEATRETTAAGRENRHVTGRAQSRDYASCRLRLALLTWNDRPRDRVT